MLGNLRHACRGFLDIAKSFSCMCMQQGPKRSKRAAQSSGSNEQGEPSASSGQLVNQQMMGGNGVQMQMVSSPHMMANYGMHTSGQMMSNQQTMGVNGGQMQMVPSSQMMANNGMHTSGQMQMVNPHMMGGNGMHTGGHMQIANQPMGMVNEQMMACNMQFGQHMDNFIQKSSALLTPPALEDGKVESTSRSEAADKPEDETAAGKPDKDSTPLEDFENQAFEKLQKKKPKQPIMKKPAAAKKNPPASKVTTATAKLKLGCLRCRGAANGCDQCRDPSFAGLRLNRSEWIQHAKKHGLKYK